MQRPARPPNTEPGKCHEQPFIKENFVPLNPPNAEEGVEGEDEGGGEEDVLGQGHENYPVKGPVRGLHEAIVAGEDRCEGQVGNEGASADL